MSVTAGLLSPPVVAERASIVWSPCPARDPVAGDKLAGLECGTLRVPLDHDRPQGEQITLALTRARHTAPRSQGAVLLNRGGPGAYGRDMPAFFRSALPASVASQYDWIGFDPRGVGASRPALVCDESYEYPGGPRPDTVPATVADEERWKRRARAFADDCARRYGRVLPHMGTADVARDLEAIRVALGERQLNYFGYSYGTYLGAVYASRYPQRVRRMVLDSVVHPANVWYKANLSQDVAFEGQIRTFFAWVARNHAIYRLGTDPKAVEQAYYRARAAVKAKPIGGKIGPAEFDDAFLPAGYGDNNWPKLALALSSLVADKDASPLLQVWQPPDWNEQNSYTIYNAVQCRDAAWPRDWKTWHDDNWRLYRSGYRFETWSNAWFNAPCAFWPVPGGPAPAIGGTGVPPMLLIQSTQDAATPYSGALEMHRRFPGSRLVVVRDNGDHGVALDANQCVDSRVAHYLGTGVLPADVPGPDAFCAPLPPPAAAAAR
ncbi:alpha/beta hydrolase [Actinomadura craniellae]|uniref:Alpha/beta hydrolase n=2 Tax=Actinomadura craniellae TaxID=2231787 RepID=A0A365H0A2_9ACTN|nr:alpha/beta hydrolase [Actinomadura craniellae]